MPRCFCAAPFAVAALCLAHVPPARAADLWIPAGPDGGTILSVAIDPQDGNTVYAGAHAAGVFKSANGGRSWRPAGLAGWISLLAVAPGTRAVYAVTLDGFFTSSDGGASWTSLGEGLRALGLLPTPTSLALPPKAPGTVYVVADPSPPTGAGRILRSTDGGISWTPTGDLPATPQLVIAHPSEPATLFATTFPTGVYTSTDSGATWSAGNLTQHVTSLAVEPGPRHRLLASVSNGEPRLPRTDLYVSSDRGRTWRLRNGLNRLPLASLLADPTTPGAFVAVDLFGVLYRTTDAGLHWTNPGTAPRRPYALALDPVRPGVAFVAVEGSRFGRSLFKTASYGAAWTPFERGIFAGDFLDVTPDPRDPATLWAGAGVASGSLPIFSPYGVWKSSDRGATWAPSGLPIDSVPAIVVAGATPSLFAATVGDGLERSVDGGRHWTRVPLAATFVSALESPRQEPDTLYALADDLPIVLATSLDGGATWKRQPLNTGLLALSPVSPATLYADDPSFPTSDPSGQDVVRRSTDRGATWTTLLHVDGTVRAVAVAPADPQRIVAGFERVDADGHRFGGVFWSADGGTTWSPADLGPERPFVASLLADPLLPHGFLAGTGAGVFASSDGGATWTSLGEGLPQVEVVHLSVDPASPRTLYAATAGGGIYRLERTLP